MSRRTLPLLALRAYESAARLGSIAAAAAELGVTPSAVSQQVKVLEETLGQQLFIRRPQSLQVSDSGLDLLAALTEAFDLLDRAMDCATLPRTGMPIDVAMPALFAAGWLLPRLAAFHRLHPGIEVRIRSSSSFMEPALDGMDIAIRHGHGGWATLDCIHLFSDRFVAVTAPARLAPCDAAMDGQHQMASSGALLTSETEPNLWDEWADELNVALPSQRGLVLAEESLVLQAAINGLGTGLLDRQFVARHVAAKSLVLLDMPCWARGSAWFLVVEEGRRLESNIAAFIAWLLQEVSEFRCQRMMEAGG